MLEVISTLLNVAFACSYISTKSSDIDEYHNDLKEFKTKVKEIEIDASTYWGNGSNSETNRLSVQIKTEIHHLIREAQCLSKRYASFDYIAVSPLLLAFKQIITGGTFETVTRQADSQKISQINSAATNLCSQIDSFYVTNKFKTSLSFWKRI